MEGKVEFVNFDGSDDKLLIGIDPSPGGIAKIECATCTSNVKEIRMDSRGPLSGSDLKFLPARLGDICKFNLIRSR